MSAQTVGPAQQLAAVNGRMPSPQRVTSTCACRVLAVSWHCSGPSADASPPHSILAAALGHENSK